MIEDLTQNEDSNRIEPEPITINLTMDDDKNKNAEVQVCVKFRNVCVFTWFFRLWKKDQSKDQAVQRKKMVSVVLFCKNNAILGYDMK